MSHEEIWIVDDEKNIRSSLEAILKDEGYRVRGAATGEELLKQAAQATPDLVILDVWLPGMDGLQALEDVRHLHPELPVIMISGHSTVETAVKATKLGAYDFIEKPLSLEKTLLAVKNALDRHRLEQENLALRRTLGERYEIVGESPGDPGIARADSLGCAESRSRPDPWRERDRERADRPGHSSAKPPDRQALRGGELRGDSRRTDRK